MEKKIDYVCKICNKIYKNYKSLWKHNYIYHKDTITSKLPQKHLKITQKHLKITQKNILLKESNLNCKFCKKILSRKDNLNRHEKICKLKDETKVEEKLLELKKEIIELKKNTKIDQKINNNTNNGIINNIHIHSVGHEPINEKLSDKEKINILTGPIFKELPLVELVRKIYTEDKFKDSRNTLITNLKSSSCLTYNKDTKQFDAVSKNKHIDNIINSRKDDIIKMFNGMHSKLKDTHREILSDYLESMEDEDNKKIYKTHKEEIAYVIYNCKNFMKEFKEQLDNLDNKIEELEKLEKLENLEELE
jgi:hypothetical protein